MITTEEINEIKNCPCNTCLVRAVCRNKVVRQLSNKESVIVIDYLVNCPMAHKYIYISNKSGCIIYQHHFHLRIRELCKIHRVRDEYFIWRASDIGFIKKGKYFVFIYE